MKRIIDIPNELAEKGHWYTDEELWAVVRAVQNGIPLDKIRAEIEEERVHDDWDFGQEIYYNNAIDDVLQIIDKYKGE